MKTIVKTYTQRALAFLFASTSLFNISCSSDDIKSGIQQGMGEVKIVAEARNKEFQNTRSALTFGSRGMDFRWIEGDELTVFAKGDDNSRNLYKLTGGNGSANAEFTADNFSLNKGVRYYALSMSESTAPAGTAIPDQRNITLNYAGQVQKGNANTSHLGHYDYMAASSICEEVNSAHFPFVHLGFTLRLVMTAESSKLEEFKATEFNEIEIYDSEDAFRQPKRIYSFEPGTSADNSTFSIVWPEQTITSSERFKLQLQNSTDATKGVKPTEDHIDGTSTDGKLVAYIELPPNDFTGKTIGFIVRGKKGGSEVTYYGNSQGRNMLNDKAYQINLELKQTTDYTVTLKVNHMWQLGSVNEESSSPAKTRATGDPGYDDKFALPTNIYYVFCVGEEVRTVDEKAVNSIEDIPATDWTTATDKVLSTYNKSKLTFTTTDADKGKSKHLYVVASTKDLSSSFSGITSSSTEANVRNLVYSIDGASATCTALDATQTFLRDLYSTPWDNEATFTGNLKNPMQDVILYHTAAKVDLKWNTPTALSTENNISVNTVNSTKLSLFTPTNNSGSETNNYTVSAPVTTGTMWNGRQVFYLPQFSTYNVTIGNKSPEDVSFSPSTANGFTSWLRWLRTY